MSSASPSDLAVTFRSVPRRLREAQGDGPPSADATGPAGELQGLLAEAGRLVRSSADPNSIADAIETVANDDWTDDVLGRLREIALDVGRLLRHIAALNEG